MQISKFTIIILLLSISILSIGQTVGKASYYSNKLHGRKTSSGYKYHKDSMTCAYRKSPIGTWLRVKNLNNEKEVIVKVTDKGPFVKGRIIDLSYAAAKELDFIRQGTTKVKVTDLGMEWTPQIENDSVKLDSIKQSEKIIVDSTKLVEKLESLKADSTHKEN